MARKIVWTASAVADIEAIVTYIQRDSPAYAAAFANLVITRTRLLNRFANRGRIIPELRDPSIREVIIQSHRLVYHVARGTIAILAVIHCRQDMHRAWARGYRVRR
jgi:toxin ParE1/3/4